MADKNYVVSLTVDDSGAVAAVNNMTTALDKADNSTQSLKAQLRSMQQQLANLDPNTEEFQKLSTAAGEIKDKINDASEAIRAQAGPAFESLGNNAALLKQRLFNLDFEGVGQSVKALAGNVNNLKFGEATKGLSSLTSGFAALGKALISNPIILIGSVIALIIVNLDKLANAIPFVGKAFEVVGDVIGKVVQGFKDLTDWIGITENAAVDAANKSIDLQDKTIKDIERNAKRQVAIAKQLGQDVNQVVIDAEQKKLETYQKTIDDINKLNGKLTDEQIKARQDASDAIFDIETARIERQADQNQKDIAAKEAREKKAQEDAQKRAEDAAQKAKERRQKEIEQRQFEAQFIADLYAEQDAQIEENNKALAERLAAIWQRANELSRAAQISQADEIEAIQLDIEQRLDEQGKSAQEIELQRSRDKYFEQKTLLEQAGQDTTALTELYESEQNAIKDKYAKEEEERQKELNRKKVQFASDAIGALSQLDAAFSANNKKGARAAFNRNKAYGIAQAGIQTGLAVTAALTAGGNPIKLATGTQFIEAGIAAATGIAQIAKIASTKFNENGGDSGGGSSSVPTVGGGGGGNQPTVPAFNALNLGFLQNRPEQTPKAYVLAQDVSTAVEARDKVRDLARIN
jgi:DNA repair exonuclease SbcCD ATPase subunit